MCIRYAGGLVIALIVCVTNAKAANILVNTGTDVLANDGLCTFREALVAAAANLDFNGCERQGAGDSDIIEFDVSLFTPLPNFAAIQSTSGSFILQGSNNVHITAPAGKYVFITGDNTEPVLELNQHTNGTLNLTRIRLLNGKSTGNGAGIKVIGDTARITMDNARIESCEADGDGGGIGLDTNEPIHIELLNNTWFINNSAGGNGGGIGGTISTSDLIAPLNQLKVDIEGGYFSGNEAAGKGGFLHVRTTPALGYDQRVDINVAGAWFNANEASDGGAFYLEVANGSTATQVAFDSEDSLYTGNIASKAGGAILIWQSSGGPSNDITTIITNNRFEMNSAGSADDDDFETPGGGGALVVVGNSAEPNGPARISRNSFLNNHSEGSGGAIWMGRVNGHLINNLIANNSAGRAGGGLFLSNLFGTLLDREQFVSFNTFHENTAGSMTADPAGWNYHFIEAPFKTAAVVRFHGNIYKSAAGPIPAGDADCYTANQGFIDSVSNVHDHASCAIGFSDTQGAPNAPLSAISDDVHTHVAIPQPGSPAIDKVPVDLCVDDIGAPLIDSMVGVRWVAGVPINGDGIGLALCDAGSMEAPAPPVNDIFNDNFER